MIADATPRIEARAPHPRWAVLLALLEAFVAFHVLGAVADRGVTFLPFALFQAAPFWVHGQSRNLVVLFVLTRRALRHKRHMTWGVPFELFVASLLCLWPCFTFDVWPPHAGFLDARMIAALSLAAASAVVAVASAFDIFAKSPRSHAEVALGVATLVTLVVVLRTRAVQEVVSFVAHEPVQRQVGLVGLGVLVVFFVALTLVRARRTRALGEVESRLLEAFVLALGFAILCGWTILMRWDPFFALTRGNALLWLVPVGLPSLACVFAPSLGTRAFRVLATWFVAWAFLVVIDRTMAVSALSFESPRHDAARYAFVGDLDHGRAYRQGRVVRVRQRFQGYPRHVWTLGDPDPGAKHTRCDTARVAVLRAHTASDPHDERPAYAGLYVHEGASDEELATCVESLEAAGFTEVAFFGRVRTPLPWWSTMHRFAHVYRPQVRVLEGPVSMLRCDAGETATCSTRGGVIRMATLKTMATSSVP